MTLVWEGESLLQPRAGWPEISAKTQENPYGYPKKTYVGVGLEQRQETVRIMKRERLEDIDRAKGLAIFLVVLGHITLRTFPADNDWYILLHKLIYTFHMPFFMFISGFIMYHTYTPIGSFSDYAAYVRKKFIRLMPAFFLMGIVVGAGKLLFRYIIHVDNLPSGSFLSFLYLLIKPIESYASSLWYIYVLFAYFLLMPVILFLIRENKLLLLIIAFLIHYVHLTKYFALDRIAEYMFVFSTGMCVAAFPGLYLKLIDRFRFLFLFLFALSLMTMPIDSNYPLAKFIIGISSIPALHSLVRTNLFSKLSLFPFLGKYTFPIYLMNTVVIGSMKGVLLRFVSWDGTNFLLIAPVLLLGGIFLPIFIKKKVISRIPALDAITN